MSRTVAGIILAAGESSRMGRTKALLPIGGDTFVVRTIRTLVAGGAGPIVVVCGDALPAIADEIERAGLGSVATAVENTRRAEGQVTSIIAGLDALGDLDVAAVLVCPVDSPLFTPETVTTLIEAFGARHAPIVRPASGSRHGHPSLFARAVFDDLRRADPAVGARAVVASHRDGIEDVAVNDKGAFIDIDTPEEYERMLESR
jgi:molybdenum cofactor cytidylyltransferase